MGQMIKNIAPTDLSTAYPRGTVGVDFSPGLLTCAKSTGITFTDAVYCWGVYTKGTAAATTCGANRPCVRVSSTTNQGMFTLDLSDGDFELRQDIGFPPAAITHGGRTWFKVKGIHDVRQSLTTSTPAVYDPFRMKGDGALDIVVSTSIPRASGVFMEAPGVTNAKLVRVRLWGKGF